MVNEAINDRQNNGRHFNGRHFNMRHSFWFRKLAADFVKHASIFAPEADPQVQLYYNGYNAKHMGSISSVGHEIKVQRSTGWE